MQVEQDEGEEYEEGEEEVVQEYLDPQLQQQQAIEQPIDFEEEHKDYQGVGPDQFDKDSDEQ